MQPTKRSFRLISEPHPFFRMPTTQKAYPISMNFMARRLGRTALFFVPAFTVMFGWSLAGKKYVNWAHDVFKKQ